MIKRLFQFVLFAVIVAALWWWLSRREAVQVPEDKSEVSYRVEQRVQDFLKKQDAVPISQQNRTEVQDGKQYVLFYKKIRVGKHVSLPEVSRSWVAFAASKGLRLREVRFRKEPHPRCNILDILLGSGEITTHHIIYTQNEFPQLVIIVDDIGYSGGKLLQRLMDLPGPLNMSIIPGTQYGKKAAEMAARKGHAVLLHLPMEPINRHWQHPAPWGISEMMSDPDIMSTVELDLAWVPHATAMNNHMGSRSTADPRIMKDILSVVKKHGLLFIDSGTTPRSVTEQVAGEMRLNILKRDVFLDVELNETYTRVGLNTLIKIARKRGFAVGICHIRYTTIASFEKNLARTLSREGVELVKATDLVQ